MQLKFNDLDILLSLWYMAQNIGDRWLKNGADGGKQAWHRKVVCQSAYIEGRLLTDNALVAFEVNHYMKTKTRGKHGVTGLEIDISKAYDRLEWTFVESMMYKFGFGQLWVDWVMKLIKSVSYSFTHHGQEFGSVIPTRGIRQGNSISLYIYIL